MNKNDLKYQLALRTAVVAGCFSVVMCALLVFDYTRRMHDDPFDEPQYQLLQEQVLAAPNDPEFKQQLRHLDLALRTQYFQQKQRALLGTYLLLGGVLVTLVAGKGAAVLHEGPPQPSLPEPRHDPELADNRVARYAVGGLTWGLISASVVLVMVYRSPLPETPPGRGVGSSSQVATNGTNGSQDSPAASAETPQFPPGLPTQEEIARNWSRFRGPGGLGVSVYDDVPTAFDGATGQNVLWRTPVPLPGNGSPIVWGDRVFLSGATKGRREVFCYSTTDGKLLWQREVPSTPASTAKTPEVMEQTGYAAPTPATDGRRVYAMFANGDVAAYDFEGRLAWARSLGIPENVYGHASSLTVYRDRLLIQFDQAGAKDGLSQLLALSVVDGKTVWHVPREVPNSWSSPIVIEHEGQPQIITCADPWVIAYEPDRGEELWRANCLAGDVGPSPVCAGDMVYVVSETSPLSAIRCDGRGDVTETHVLWQADIGLPDTCSPLATDRFVLLLASYGTLSCYDAKKGGSEPLWEEDFDGSFTASPSLVGNRVYLVSEQGKVFIVEPTAEACKHIAEADLGEPCVTSPAFQPGRIYLRGKEHLFCLGAKGVPKTKDD